jgi:iron complex transport system permease protein
MRVVLDLSKLLAEGAITQTEHDRMLSLSRTESVGVLINVLVGFGVIAVTGALIALVPNAIIGTLMGALLMGVSWLIRTKGGKQWNLLSTICIMVSSLFLGAGSLLISQGALGPHISGPVLMPFPFALLTVAAAFVAIAIPIRSAILVTLATLMTFAALGARSWYSFAMYELSVPQPLLTVVIFSIVAELAFLLSKYIKLGYDRLPLFVARTSIFLVNLGFWIGSLWGDSLNWLPGRADSHEALIHPIVFVIAWAVALLGAGVWAGYANRRWMLNIVAIFGGIHFYTQFFERLGATPWSMLLGGVVLLALALGLRRVNQNMVEEKKLLS